MAHGLAVEAAHEETVGNGPWIATGANIYRVGPDQSAVRVQLDNPTLWWRVALQSAFTAVPIPAGAEPSRDGDAEMTIWQPSTDKLWEFFQMRLLADGWHAGWGGAMQSVSRNPGYYDSTAWPGALSAWGATASSLPHAAGVITLGEIAQGHIDHALAVNLPAPRSGVWSWPAQRSDGTNTDPNSIPEGARLRIDPSLDLGKLKLPRMVFMMAKSVQTYGMIVRDQTHIAINFWIENPAPSGTSPFYLNGVPTPDGPFEGLWPNELLKYFPWSSLQVVKMQLSGPGLQ